MSTSALQTAVTGAVAEKPKDIFGMLKVYSAEIARALPRHMNADRMARIVTTEIRRTPKLLQCDAKSLFGAVIQSSQLGLEPGGGLGHAYLVPYGKECQLIIGYRGMIDLARRSGQMVSLAGEAVYAKDRFEYELGLEPKLKHVPSTDEDRGPLVYVYAVACLVGGGRQFVVMSKGDVDKIRKRSKAGESGPWKTDYDAMAIKTAIRRLFKYLPVSVEVTRAAVFDEAGDRGAQNNAAVLDGEFLVSDDDTPPGDDEAGATTDSDGKGPMPGSGGPTVAEVKSMIEAARSAQGVDDAMLLAAGLPEQFRGELEDAAKQRRKALAA